MPSHPLPELKRIFVLNVHGSIVYLTREEDLLLKWLFGLMLVSGVSAGILNVVGKREGKGDKLN